MHVLVLGPVAQQCWQRILPEVSCAESEDLTKWWETMLICYDNDR